MSGDKIVKEALPEESTEVKIKPSQTKISYRTKIQFNDAQRGKKDIVSVEPPSISQAGILTFLLSDRVICYHLSVIFNWETEQLMDIEPPKIIL